MKIKAVGIPYKGSKRKLIKNLNEIFEKVQPKDIILYDLFGGGGSVSFSIAQNPNVKKVIYNELDKNLFDFVMFLKNTSEEEFFERFYKPFYGRNDKPKDKIDKIFFERCYSFGNDGSGYIYSKEIEDIKRSLHYVIIHNDEKHIENIKKFYGDVNLNEIIEMGMPKNDNEVQKKKLKLYEVLKPFMPPRRNLVAHINNINLLAKTLPHIKNKKIEFHNKSYLDFKNFEKNSIIYLDPPYQNTSGYNSDFNFNLFNDFISKNKCIISEYNLEHKDYEIIYQKGKNDISRKIVQEKIYAHKNYNYTNLNQEKNSLF